MACIAVFMANSASINALIDMYSAKDQTSFLINVLKWIECLMKPGNKLAICETAADNANAIWRSLVVGFVHFVVRNGIFLA